MLQEDSNGETGFEFIEQKTDELSLFNEAADSVSSMSSTPSLIPSPSVPVAGVPSSGGNLLSNVPPPSELPSFISTTVAPVPIPTSAASVTRIEDCDQPEIFYPRKFSPAIPPSKGLPAHGQITSDTSSGGSVQADAANSLFGWVKDAVSSGGILSKVAEKAKNSVDSMITTLDPQMREFIYSGGDVDVLVASDSEIKISPIREAFQAVFGKATVSGISVQCTSIAVQPVGFAAGIKAAEERIAGVYTEPQVHPLPVVAVESFLLEVGEDRWYDMTVLILSDPSKKIYLQTFTQTTPVPSAVVSVLQEDTPSDYPLRWSGYSATVCSLMAKNLQVDRTQWQHMLTGVSTRECILAAARTLAGLYKTSLSQA